jgi:hypothetical protein
MTEEGADIGQHRDVSRLETDAVKTSTTLPSATGYESWTTKEEFQKKVKEMD